MPEWQGAGVGSKFLNFIGEYCAEGKARCNRRLPLYFHTSHPQLCAYLRHSKKWVQVSAEMFGVNKKKNAESINKKSSKQSSLKSTGYGGHFRAVQGFKFIGGV
jgi:hypothetical protein